MAGRNAQKADVILKDFWRQNERFADLFNAVIFRGKQIIKPEDLSRTGYGYVRNYSVQGLSENFRTYS